MKNRQVNVVIVGSGAGGGVVAKELSTAGLSVVLFEGEVGFRTMIIPTMNSFPNLSPHWERHAG